MKDKCNIGLDMSVTSPAMTFIFKDKKEFHIYFCSDRKKHIGFKKSKKIKSHGKEYKFKFINIIDKPIEFEDNYDKIIFIVDKFITAIKKHGIINLYIEDYAFGASSSSVSILCELGGHLRAMLRKNNIPFKLVNNKRIKKLVTGRGEATKYEMFLKFCSHFDYDWKKMFEDTSGGIGHPLEDMIDSFFIGIKGRESLGE